MPYMGHNCKAGREYPSMQFTVNSSQLTVGNPHQRVVSREHTENGERKTENNRTLFATPPIGASTMTLPG